MITNTRRIIYTSLTNWWPTCWSNPYLIGSVRNMLIWKNFCPSHSNLSHNLLETFNITFHTNWRSFLSQQLSFFFFNFFLMIKFSPLSREQPESPCVNNFVSLLNFPMATGSLRQQLNIKATKCYPGSMSISMTLNIHLVWK